MPRLRLVRGSDEAWYFPNALLTYNHTNESYERLLLASSYGSVASICEVSFAPCAAMKGSIGSPAGWATLMLGKNYAYILPVGRFRSRARWGEMFRLHHATLEDC
jgi:hypothetical protein